MNLLKETKEVLEENGKKLTDIKWVGIAKTEFVEIDIDKFLKIADNLYDNGYGGTEINESLIIVGEDWWLERAEYDGAEWWEYKTMPKRPNVKSEFDKFDIFTEYSREEESEWED